MTREGTSVGTSVCRSCAVHAVHFHQTAAQPTEGGEALQAFNTLVSAIGACLALFAGQPNPLLNQISTVQSNSLWTLPRTLLVNGELGNLSVAAVRYGPSCPPLASFILALFNIFIPPDASQHPAFPLRNNFRLRHFHAVIPSACVYFADVPPHTSGSPDSQPVSLPIAPVRTALPPSTAAFAKARALSMRGQSITLDWEEIRSPGPEVS